MPRAIPYAMIAIAAILSISILRLPDLLIVPVLLIHMAVMLLDPDSVDFSIKGKDRRSSP